MHVTCWSLLVADPFVVGAEAVELAAHALASSLLRSSHFVWSDTTLARSDSLVWWWRMCRSSGKRNKQTHSEKGLIVVTLYRFGDQSGIRQNSVH